MKVTLPVLQKGWLPTSFEDANTRDAIDIIANGVIALEEKTDKATATLEQQVAEQAKHIEQLQAVVAALSELLVDKGTLDPGVLEVRAQANHDQLNPPDVDPRAVGDHPYRTSPAGASPAEPKVACTKCGDRVAVGDTQITEAGPICDPCHTKQFTG